MACVDALETQITASHATVTNLLSALVAKLTTANSAKGAAQASPGQRPGKTSAERIKG